MIGRVKDKQIIQLGKQLRERYNTVAYELVRGRLRMNAHEINDPALLEALQNDRQLIDAILMSDGEARPLIKQWIEDHYEQKNGSWEKRHQENAYK